MRMRISRPCYDKPWRCPGWAGGGTRSARVSRCASGSMAPAWEAERHPQWRSHRCPRCGVHVLPYVVRWLDVGWYRWQMRWALRRLRDLWVGPRA